MAKTGFTLLEVTISTALLAVIGAIMFGLAQSMFTSGSLQDSKLTATFQASAGLSVIVAELRRASADSIVIDGAGLSIQYQVPEDLDENGIVLDQGGTLELGLVKTLGRDVDDVNGDGITDTQLVVYDDNEFRVLANYLSPSEDENGNGELDAGEDVNENGQLDRGLVFERFGRSVRVTIQVARSVSPTYISLTTTRTITVHPRN